MRTLAFLLLSIFLLKAEDWTVDGKDYHNVKVGLVEADRVHVAYAGGIGTILIADMPPELRKRFAFDPAKAKAEADARESGRLAAVASLPPPTAPAPLPASVPVTTMPLKSGADPGVNSARIAALLADIAFMVKDDAKKKHGDTKGAYPQMIADEKAELARLQGTK